VLKRTNKYADSIVEQAKRHVGYRAQPNRQSAFQLPTYGGRPWGGTFIDRVLHDAFGDFSEVRFVSTVTALGYFVKRNRVYLKPRRGDVVFFNFATDPQHAFEQPHIGVVVEVNTNGSIRTVEGETSPGTPQGSQLVDGVFERTRWPVEVLGYVRPVPRKIEPSNDEPQKIKMSFFNSNPKTQARAVATVQTALNKVRPAWMFNRGKKNGEFKAAFGTYARETGWVENRGELLHGPLTTLADETGTFELE
jgi:hypothetical protein